MSLFPHVRMTTTPTVKTDGSSRPKGCLSETDATLPSTSAPPRLPLVASQLSMVSIICTELSRMCVSCKVNSLSHTGEARLLRRVSTPLLLLQSCPLLVDKRAGALAASGGPGTNAETGSALVNNESADIMRMFATALRPRELRKIPGAASRPPASS